MARFIASLTMEISDTTDPREAARIAEQRIRDAIDDLIIIVRDSENGVITTYDVPEQEFEYHDLNGNEISEQESIGPRMRLVE